MTKQQEIREALISKVKSIRLWATRSDDPMSVEDDVDDILKVLASQGAVLKIKGEDLPGKLVGELHEIAVSYTHIFEEYGFNLSATEPLI